MKSFEDQRPGQDFQVPPVKNRVEDICAHMLAGRARNARVSKPEKTLVLRMPCEPLPWPWFPA